jgi:tetratricopeptide (TPR) repeat protein
MNGKQKATQHSDISRFAAPKPLANLRVVVVFLLPAYVIDLIRSHALNLWSWRAHHYVLESPDDRHGQDEAVLSFATGHTIPPGDTPETRDRRIRILQRLLDEGLAQHRSPDSLARSVLFPLADELYIAGRFTESLTVLDLLQEKVANSPESTETAEILNRRGITLAALGNTEEAIPLLQRALTIREQILGLNHPDIAQSLNNLAGSMTLRGSTLRPRPFISAP